MNKFSIKVEVCWIDERGHNIHPLHGLGRDVYDGVVGNKRLL